MDFAVARALHVLGVLLWIGGVAFVTTVTLPAVRRLPAHGDHIATFERIEHAFSRQARITTVLTGATGFYMTHLIGGWSRFLEPSYWWMHAMVAIWLVFTVILFALEPLLLSSLFARLATERPEQTFAWVHRLHWILLTLSLVTVAGAVAGSHGGIWLAH